MTECAHCKRSFKTIKEYAQHIIDKHSFDAVRVAWAKDVLGTATIENTKQPGNVDQTTEVVAPGVVEGEGQAKTQGGSMQEQGQKPKVQTPTPNLSAVKRIFRSPATILAVIALLASIYALATVRNVYYGEINTLKTTVAGMQSSVTTHDGNIATLIAAKDSLQANYDVLAASYSVLNASYGTLSVAYSTLNVTYTELVNNMSTLAASMSNLTVNVTMPRISVADVASMSVTLELQDLSDETICVIAYGLNTSNAVVNASVATVTQTAFMYTNSTDFNTVCLVRIAPVSNWTGMNSLLVTFVCDDILFADAWIVGS